MTARGRARRSILAMLVLVATGCGDEPVVVAFGDSTTTWRGPETNWVLLLREELEVQGRPVEWVDAGVSSDTTELARERLWWDVLRHRPDVTVIQFGINDALVRVDTDPPSTSPRVDIERYEANLRHLIERVRAWGSDVILMTPNPLRWSEYTRAHYSAPPYRPEEPRGMNVLLDDYAEVVRRVAGDERVELVDVQRMFEAAGEGGGPGVAALLRDGVHPNDRAYRLIADGLHPVLSRMLRVGRPSSGDARREP